MKLPGFTAELGFEARTKRSNNGTLSLRTADDNDPITPQVWMPTGGFDLLRCLMMRGGGHTRFVIHAVA